MKYSRLSIMTIVAITMVFYDYKHGNLRLSIIMIMNGIYNYDNGCCNPIIRRVGG
jgi:hypothetical protein